MTENQNMRVISFGQRCSMRSPLLVALLGFACASPGNDARQRLMDQAGPALVTAERVLVAAETDEPPLDVEGPFGEGLTGGMVGAPTLSGGVGGPTLSGGVGGPTLGGG